ncbi:caspase family protein [Sulfitobacter sediminilitoris]|uniref:caspase family protein n=1 Tax=Sulfitobacter sediminilitoris TaxID=2698830 RepID=UPI003611F20F
MGRQKAGFGHGQIRLIRPSCLLAIFGLATAAEARRVALVIGNSDYSHATMLPNPANDARDIATAFTSLDYQVELVEDATRADLLDALRGFRTRSIGAEHAIIYYAGHGVEIDRQNFVIPVDAELKADIDVEYEAVPLQLLVAATSGARGLQLVVLDACRDNPFLAQMTRTLSTRSIGRGLAIYEPEGNSLVAYSAREGTVALDGTGENSPYAMAFLSALQRPGLEIGHFFRQVRDAVIRQTNGQQEPFLYGSLSADPVFFQLQGTPAAPEPQNTAPSRQGTGASADTLLAIDLAFWQSIKDSDQRSDFEDYLSRFPAGQFLPLAQRRLAALKAPEKPLRSAIKETATVPPATTSEPEANQDPAQQNLRLSRSDARDLQARLNILNYGAGVEDGIVGRRTLQAVADYKSARAMANETLIDAALMARITSEIPEAQLAAHRKGAPKPKNRPTPPPEKDQTRPTRGQFRGLCRPILLPLEEW